MEFNDGARLYNLLRFVSWLILGDAPAFGQVNRSITAGAGGSEACRSILAGWTSDTASLNGGSSGFVGVASDSE